MADSSRTTATPSTRSTDRPAAPFASADIVRRRSRIHGSGVFAKRPIPRGTRVIEYTGERITTAEADRRYEDRPARDNHTYLFMVSSRTVVDGGSGGNVARFINHACAPNCEVEISRGRIFIDAIRDIAPGDELSYDYALVRDASDPPDIDEIFACRCGSPKCRGTMMEPRRKRAAKKKTRTATKGALS